MERGAEVTQDVAVTGRIMQSVVRKFLAEATPAQRCLVGIGLNVPFLLAFIGAMSTALFVEGFTHYFNVPWMQFALLFVVGSLVLQAFMALWLWPRRFSHRSLPVFTPLMACTIMLPFAMMAFLGGNLTYPTNLVIIGIIPIGLLLLDVRSVGIAFLMGVALIWLNDVADLTGFVDYAPGYRTTAFVEGEHRFWPEVLRSGVLYVSLLSYAVQTWLLFNQYDFQHRRLTALSQSDGLTGLANRRHFMATLEAELQRAQHRGDSLAVVMMDADHFKRINDRYGHDAGDRVLRVLGDVLTDEMRDSGDLAARIGGEEFALLLPDTNLSGAKALCERIGARVRSIPFSRGRDSFRVTLSMGVAAAGEGTPEALMRTADERLYHAKRQGRDAVSLAEEEGDHVEPTAGLA